LGRWFLTPKRSQQAVFEIKKDQEDEVAFAERHFIPFKSSFVLHPGTFALGATLEWIRVPKCLTGIIVGKSSWGRRGLIIETAPTVHPGFSGCLTLELTNVGEIPIKLYPSMPICQLQLANAEGEGSGAGAFDGIRRPVLGTIKLTKMTRRLRGLFQDDILQHSKRVEK
jgi:dCTP deaminase